MERTVFVKVCDRIGCCVGDMVYMTVKDKSKLVSYGSACETSEVPAFVIGAGLNSDGTYSYVVKYNASVLRHECNYLVPTDIVGLCCAECCPPPRCECNDPCIKPEPCKSNCVCGNCLPKQTVNCNHERNNSCLEDTCCATIIKGVNCG